MTKLEKYIVDHLDEFDSVEPPQGHFQRFEDQLANQPRLKAASINQFLALKIAAVILILIAVSVFVFDFATREIRERFSSGNRESEMPLEIREAVAYYENQTSTQIATIHKLSENQKDAGLLSESALKEIRSLDTSTDELKMSLTQNPGNERILDAIIRNQQMKEAMLNTIITQLSQAVK